VCAELRKGGREMVVSLENLSSYVSLVSHWLLVEGVSTQMEAVREGFTSVFPIASLQMFYPGTLHRSYTNIWLVLYLVHFVFDDQAASFTAKH
jgi:hypothetical protein